MATASPVHPILIDTSGLIATANTSLWGLVCATLQMTTTNVVKGELERHVRETNEYAPPGSREYQLHHGSKKVVTVLNQDDGPISIVNCVPRPHGDDAGEESMRQLLAQDPTPYKLAILMDRNGRRSLRRTIQNKGVSIPVVGPPYLFYLLEDEGEIDRETFCRACGEMIDNEGWTGYHASKAAWEAIPTDCSDVLDDRLLPP